ncbi:MAG: CHAT domain-containing protein, partial [bacterium]|nr:CHAT domain-containing protein [bacterium]
MHEPSPAAVYDQTEDFQAAKGHTAFYPDDPESTGIVCADGTLSGNDVAGLRNLPALVFFNSCESARVGGLGGGTGAGTGVERSVGLAEAFLRGGVGNYVGTRWELSDAAAPAFMTTFYGDLLQQAPRAVRVLERQGVRRPDARGDQLRRHGRQRRCFSAAPSGPPLPCGSPPPSSPPYLRARPRISVRFRRAIVVPGKARRRRVFAGYSEKAQRSQGR